MVSARHHTRNHGNKYQTWALAYAIRNRISTTKLDGTNTKMASAIDANTFILNELEKKRIRDRLTNMVTRVVKKHLPAASGIEVDANLWHPYVEQSKRKSEMVLVYSIYHLR